MCALCARVFRTVRSCSGAHLNRAYSGYSPLGKAAALPLPALVEELIRRGAKPSGDAHDSPLLRAVSAPWSADQREVIDILLRYGADFHATCQHRTVLSCVIFRDKVADMMRLAEFLAARGADFGREQVLQASQGAIGLRRSLDFVFHYLNLDLQRVRSRTNKR